MLMGGNLPLPRRSATPCRIQRWPWSTAWRPPSISSHAASPFPYSRACGNVAWALASLGIKGDLLHAVLDK